jgi:hypothetical protein
LTLLAFGALTSVSCIEDFDHRASPCDGGKRVMTPCGVGSCFVLVDVCAGGQPAECAECAPGTPSEELCHDGIDNDCDGQIDECPTPCEIMTTTSCYTASPATLDVGLCRSGLQMCIGEQWGACLDYVIPSPETCDGRDNDCDGLIDEGCKCSSGQVQHCYGGAEDTINIGPCKVGLQTCEFGHWGACVADVLPTLEFWDGVDNDCDGQVDEGVVLCPPGEAVACFEGDPSLVGVGECREGEATCMPGGYGPCVGQILPTVESCNGKDDDCNGPVDDGPFCCPDGLENGDESDVDCGGSCQPCDPGKGCKTGADCASQSCVNDVCQ